MIASFFLTSLLAVSQLAPHGSLQVPDDRATTTLVRTDVGPTAPARSDSSDFEGSPTCGDFVFDSGDATATNSGGTVGRPGAERIEIYQPIVFAQDVMICGIDLDGWYIDGTPETFQVSIYPNASGIPDIDNPLTGGPIRLGEPFTVNWASADVPPIKLSAGVTYYVGTDSGDSNHWSAIYRVPSSGLSNAMSVFDGDFTDVDFGSPIALRLRGGDATCTSTVALAYDGAELQMGFTIGTKLNGTWGAWMLGAGGFTPLWMAPLPAIDPPQPVFVDMPMAPGGSVAVISGVFNSMDRCWAIDVVTLE